MRMIIGIIAVVAIGMFLVMTQTAPRTSPTGALSSAPVNPSSVPVNQVAANEAPPMAGANSFTEAQAKDRIEAAGFVNVVALAQDQDGIWRASAMKNGAPVKVALDFKGNVVVN